jgi:hypothetical protein
MVTGIDGQIDAAERRVSRRVERKVESYMFGDSTLHHAIINSFLEQERAPSLRELSSRFSCEEPEVRDALRALADYHGVVLQPQSGEIWIAHPFSAAPTTCIVRSSDKSWWGNCVWCSLGVAHLVGGDATITTTLGAIGDQVTVRVKGGELLDRDYVVHFPIPMAQAWENVVYTCSVMLLFRSEAEVDFWCAKRGIAKGDVRPIEQIWTFASEWYGRHADPNWTKWTVDEAVGMFSRHGLNGPI